MSWTWTYSTCENCLRNAHKESKMVKRTVTSADGNYSEEFWVCTKCGFTRKL